MMNEQLKMQRLRIFLRIYGGLTWLIFGVLSIGFILQLPQFNPGGAFHWLIWDEVSDHVGPMLVAIYLVWGAFFFLAANKPYQYRSFLDFTMWANLAHGLLMVPMALEESHLYHTKFLTDIPFILGLSVGIYFWRPASVEQPPRLGKVEA